ncbi:GTPase Era [Clostridium thermosuccinogenes]|jgi:GTP-binding protein Era|uniref:GTPase Era n=1 Tax=Clostridium thermosuccinogenes TaxID=84032 RepID=A0A2K2F2E0_9CLOT|nr:GTPase Era [Pseudoclostridium thermosuccinogenes]AUS96391.1 GTPase Era [Pseudoclostridium thermosuccinogenes]PNT92943.1 GTPase Era [Pseudoclostridium thermosuccinogenes]PNT95659.1 GTPase Era [Pseudoclostridium thermosuccinogenes]PNT96882.1 GTPase Era [Pseudoclostridium thermosuccinogenes]
MSFKSGFVTIVGRPNVGKSTLLNRFAGEKIAIISEKPQTTRNSIKAVITDEDSQIIFIDTPGVHKPKTKLGEYMISVVQESLNEVDIVLFLVEATDSAPGAGDQYIIEQLKDLKTPVFLLINKIDLVKKEQLLAVIANYKNLMDFAEIIPISAVNNEGIDIVLKEIRKRLPDGPKYFPDDMLTDQPEKAIVAELIREKILELLSDEVPHGTGIEVISFKERTNKELIDIDATIYCEKESHKAIIIGKEGRMLKKIGSRSREDIERFLGTRVYLRLWVKVKDDWRNSDAMLKTLGYRK